MNNKKYFVYLHHHEMSKDRDNSGGMKKELTDKKVIGKISRFHEEMWHCNGCSWLFGSITRKNSRQRYLFTSARVCAKNIYWTLRTVLFTTSQERVEDYTQVVLLLLLILIPLNAYCLDTPYSQKRNRIRVQLRLEMALFPIEPTYCGCTTSQDIENLLFPMRQRQFKWFCSLKFFSCRTSREGKPLRGPVT